MPNMGLMWPIEVRVVKRWIRSSCWWWSYLSLFSFSTVGDITVRQEWTVGRNCKALCHAVTCYTFRLIAHSFWRLLVRPNIDLRLFGVLFRFKISCNELPKGIWRDLLFSWRILRCGCRLSNFFDQRNLMNCYVFPRWFLLLLYFVSSFLRCIVLNTCLLWARR